jgi:hypothetical protein
MVDYDEIGYWCWKPEIVFSGFFEELWYNFSFEQSTRKCKWKSYDGQDKFLDDLKGMQVIVLKRAYIHYYVDHFVKLWKKNMREFTRKSGIRNPIDVRLDKWGRRDGGH